jgi:hypothetical protein
MNSRPTDSYLRVCRATLSSEKVPDSHIKYLKRRDVRDEFARIVEKEGGITFEGVFKDSVLTMEVGTTDDRILNLTFKEADGKLIQL